MDSFSKTYNSFRWLCFWLRTGLMMMGAKSNCGERSNYTVKLTHLQKTNWVKKLRFSKWKYYIFINYDDDADEHGSPRFKPAQLNRAEPLSGRGGLKIRFDGFGYFCKVYPILQFNIACILYLLMRFKMDTIKKQGENWTLRLTAQTVRTNHVVQDHKKPHRFDNRMFWCANIIFITPWYWMFGSGTN